ncbi:hypothetical protein C8J56DRAFT_869102 [Mycena floridula]|nr:hypothetical protein C8J56DRAFT_869102 [Mycena floridula]
MDISSIITEPKTRASSEETASKAVFTFSQPCFPPIHVPGKWPDVAEPAATPPNDNIATSEKIKAPPADFSLEDIPTSGVKSIRDGLRKTVMTRVLCETQTRDERTEHVLLANSAIAANSQIPAPFSTEVVSEVMGGERLRTRLETFAQTKNILLSRLVERETALDSKIDRLKEEYLDLHREWQMHCATIEDLIEEEPPIEEPPIVARRATRRSGIEVPDSGRATPVIPSKPVNVAEVSVRNLATIPDMFSVTDADPCLYDDTNLLVENPAQYYDVLSQVDNWTEEEQQLMYDAYCINPKQFGFISDAVPNKTTKQCVAFYYLHKHRSIDFRKGRQAYAPTWKQRTRAGKGKDNALLTDIRDHDAETHRPITRSRTGTAVPEAPVAATEVKAAPEVRRPIARKPQSTRVAVTPIQTPRPSPTPEPDEPHRRPKRKRAPVPSSRLRDQSEETPTPPPERSRPAKRSKRQYKSAAIIEDDDDTPPPKEENPADRKRWSDKEKVQFMQLVAEHGGDYKRIAASLPNKSAYMVAQFYKSHIEELGLEEEVPTPPQPEPEPTTPEPEVKGEKTIPGIVAPGSSVPDHTPGSMSVLSFDNHAGSKPPGTNNYYKNRDTWTDPVVRHGTIVEGIMAPNTSKIDPSARGVTPPMASLSLEQATSTIPPVSSQPVPTNSQTTPYRNQAQAPAHWAHYTPPIEKKITPLSPGVPLIPVERSDQATAAAAAVDFYRYTGVQAYGGHPYSMQPGSRYPMPPYPAYMYPPGPHAPPLPRYPQNMNNGAPPTNPAENPYVRNPSTPPNPAENPYLRAPGTYYYPSL